MMSFPILWSSFDKFCTWLVSVFSTWRVITCYYDWKIWREEWCWFSLCRRVGSVLHCRSVCRRCSLKISICSVHNFRDFVGRWLSPVDEGSVRDERLYVDWKDSRLLYCNVISCVLTRFFWCRWSREHKRWSCYISSCRGRRNEWCNFTCCDSDWHAFVVLPLASMWRH